MAQPGEILAGRYRIQEVLDRGPPTATCTGVRLADGAAVTIKVLQSILAGQKEHLGRFEREADAMSRLRHPAVPRVLDFVSDDKSHFLAMELCSGETLAARIQRLGGLPFSQVVRMLDWLLEVLGHLHENQIVHRDLNPKNLVFGAGPDGEILRMLDFRSARIGEVALMAGRGWVQIGTGGGSMKLTQMGTTLGTPEYQAPEQISTGEVDGRADLYQLGCVGYAMLTGAPPFAGKSFEVMTKQLKEAPEPPGRRRPDLGIPPGLEAWILAMLRKDVAERFLDAKTAREALSEAMEHGALPGWARAAGDLAPAPALATPPPAARSGQVPAAQPRQPVTTQPQGSKASASASASAKASASLPPGTRIPTPPPSAAASSTSHPRSAARPGSPIWLWPAIIGAIALLAAGILLAVFHHGSD